MKKSIIILCGLILLAVFTPNHTKAIPTSNIKTDSIWVNGLCNMCKDRIENAALIKGVKKVSWDKKTKILTVIYDSNKTNIDKIQKAIAEAGHDTKKYKAQDEVYKRLPKCCAYREAGAHTH
jgi:copper chaperone CopZ